MTEQDCTSTIPGGTQTSANEQNGQQDTPQTLADPAGRFDELRHVSSSEGIPVDFVVHYQGILSSRSEREAMSRAIDAIIATLHPNTLTVTRKNEAGAFVLVDNYLDGKPWDYLLGEAAPEYSLSEYISHTGRIVYRDVSLAKADDYDRWFLGRSLIGVPIKSPDASEVTGTFVIGFDDAACLTESAATIASIISAGYSSVVGNALRLDEGVEIGRAIEQERMVQRLHDTTVQEIFACECAVESILTQYGSDATLTGALESLLTLLHGANRNLRQVLRDASSKPVSSGQVSVSTLVDTAIAAHDSAGGCPVTLMARRSLEVSASIGDVVQSVLTEALANVRKHARAQNVIVSYGDLSDGVFFLNIDDDGVGFTPSTDEHNDSATLHFGISNLNYLVRRAGGTFSIASEEGAGTTVRVRIPMRLEGIAHE